MSENNVSPLSAAPSIFSAAYWKTAAMSFKDVRMLVFAALIVALRVAVKLLRVPMAAGLSFSYDCYINSLGSLVYGPLMALLCGAVSDTLGCIIAPNGPYFFPFIFVEMGSAFIFALFFWRRRLSIPRVLTAKFTVNFICNIILTSLFMKWSYYIFYGVEKAEAYAIINGVRIVKNLVLFPLEAMLIALLLSALTPALRSMRLLEAEHNLALHRRHYWIIAALTVLSAALILFYVFFLKDFISAHNFKWL